MKNRKNLIGLRVSRLVVVEQAEPYLYPTGKSSTKWKCLCNCGNTVEVLGTRLTGTKKTNSCGCLQKEKASISGTNTRQCPKHNAWNNYYCSYRSGARERKYDWNLTLEQFISIASSDCRYCGVAPTLNDSGKKAYLSSCKIGEIPIDHKFAEDKIIFSNGVDRVDNAQGYHPDNVVPCCTQCNYAKLNRTESEFVAWIFRAAKHLAGS